MASWPSRLRRAAAPTRGYAVLCAAAAVLATGLLVAFVTGAGGPVASQNISNVALFLAATAAAWAGLVKAIAATRERPRVRWAWGLVGLGALSWSIGQAF